jgi:hypothetical protein
MALVAERPNLFVINDNQDIFGGATPFKADKPSASKAKHGLVAFSTDAIRQMWQRAPETRELAQVRREHKQYKPSSANLVNFCQEKAVETTNQK